MDEPPRKPIGLLLIDEPIGLYTVVQLEPMMFKAFRLVSFTHTTRSLNSNQIFAETDTCH